MVGTHFTKDRDDGVSVLAGIDPPSSLGPPQAGSVIQFRPRVAAASMWSDDANSLDEDVYPLGLLAVRLVGNFSVPRLLVVRQDQSQGAS